MKGILCLFVFAFLSVSFTGIENSGYDIGDIATDFSLKGVDGKKVSLADYKNVKGYIVIFTCNSCPYAVAYEDRIIELSKKYKNTYPVIAINPNDAQVQPSDSYDKMKERAKSKKFDFPYLVDETQTIFPAYGAIKTPHVYLLDKNRVVKYIGAIDDNSQDASAVKSKYVEEAIADLEAGREVKLAVTKAVGCGIKAKKKTVN
ncbi:MAG TPA: thioredoxin family protein [Saprospiraceae bacterium]|nr:thioredoxin family protein [Saprospiraceae bacterium]